MKPRKAKGTRSNKQKISPRLVFATLGITVGILLLIYIADITVLRRVYYYEKESAMVRAFETISNVSEEAKESDENFRTTFETLSMQNDLSMMIIQSDGSVLLSSRGENENYYMVNQFLYAILNGTDASDETVLRSTESYVLREQTDERLNANFLVLWGTLKNDNIIMIRCGIESITEAISLFNRFLLIGGLMTLALGGIVSWILSGKVSALQKDIEMREKNEDMRREFISNVSHELKTPLALIRGYAEGLAEGVTTDPEECRYYTDVIIDEAEKMNRMVKELSALNQLEYGQETLVMTEFDVAEMLRAIVGQMKVMADEFGAEMICDESCDMPAMISADEFLLEQVISNYLSNAVRYAKYDKKIVASIVLRDKRVRLCVFNTGDPIPESDLPHIWEKFYKVDRARSREVGGSGIGLSVVKAAADAFRTDCGVENRENGVLFWFDLDKSR